MLLLRFTVFFLERLPTHAGFNSADVAVERRKLKSECKAVLEEVFALKSEVLRKFEAEAEVRIRTELAEAEAAEAERAAMEAEAARVAEVRAVAAARAAAEMAELDEVRAIAAAADRAEAEAEAEAAARAEWSARAGWSEPDMAQCYECGAEDEAYPGGMSYPTVASSRPPPPPAYDDVAPVASVTAQRLVAPPLVPPSQPSVVTGLPVAAAPPSRSALAAPPSPPAYLAAAMHVELERQQPPAVPPVRPPAPAAPLSGLAALNMGSLSLGGGGGTPGLTASTASAAASSVAGNNWASGGGSAFDLSIPTGAPRRTPAPWGGSRASGGATLMPAAASATDAAPSSGGCNCRPPPFAWGGAVPPRAPSSAGGDGVLSLRPLIVPSDLPRVFLGLAQSNTSRNVETCGILVGTIVKGELVCDRLLLPNQTGTSDTCVTTNEDEIWEYCSSNELCTFGWVHTHPSQTCFLSSVDLHTQCGYQSMLDEAIAIVLSPKHAPSQAAFRLSHPNPPGLAEVQRCRKSGFHPDHQRNGPNAGNGVYEECAHVRWTMGAPLQVVDLRR